MGRDLTVSALGDMSSAFASELASLKAQEASLKDSDDISAKLAVGEKLCQLQLSSVAARDFYLDRLAVDDEATLRQLAVDKREEAKRAAEAPAEEE
jgi:hypothetical protein